MTEHELTYGGSKYIVGVTERGEACIALPGDRTDVTDRASRAMREWFASRLWGRGIEVRKWRRMWP